MTANAIDLTTVAAANNYLNQPGVDASIIQGLITAYSRAVLTRTGRRNLSSIQNYSETYSGSGSDRLQLRNYPILAVSSLVVGVTAIPQSPRPTQVGWVIDTSGSQATLALRGASSNGLDGFSRFSRGQGNWGAYGNAPPLGYSPYRFVEGVQNVAVSYTAGYVLDAIAEAQTVPGTPGPYTVAVDQADDFWLDQGVTLEDGTALTGVPATPGPGEYTPPAYGVAPLGVYTFNAAQQGVEVNISYQYGGTPEDLSEAVTEWVGDVYRSRQWIGQKSQMQPGVGTTSYATWPMPDRVKSLCDFYRMRFITQ
jgi:hypothetical protein